jgi:hypothetical protein
VLIQNLTYLAAVARERQHESQLDVGVTYVQNQPLRGVRTLPLYGERYVHVTSAPARSERSCPTRGCTCSRCPSRCARSRAAAAAGAIATARATDLGALIAGPPAGVAGPG